MIPKCSSKKTKRLKILLKSKLKRRKTQKIRNKRISIFWNLLLIAFRIYNEKKVKHKNKIVHFQKEKGVFSYVPVPKAANTSILDTLRKNFEIKKTKTGSEYSFSIVRNPYDRLVSCYTEKILDPFHRKRDNISKEHEYYNRLILEEGFFPKESFKSFVKKVCKISDRRSDKHFRSQHCFLLDKKGRWIPDFLGKFENLEEDFKKICKKMGVSKPPSLPHKRKSKRIDGYRDYYDEETKRLVERRYKKDLELFGYKF